MASSCCGGKKQKLNNSQPNSCPSTMNGHGHSNGYGGAGRSHDMYADHNGHSSAMANGHHNGLQNGMSHGLKGGAAMTPYSDRIASPDMCFFCFDVLYGSLHNLEPPKAPNFTNDALYVKTIRKCTFDHAMW